MGIVPEGWGMAWDLAFLDLERGKDGFTGKPIERHAATKGVWPLMSLLCKDAVWDQCLPPDFLQAVRKVERAMDSAPTATERILATVEDIADKAGV